MSNKNLKPQIIALRNQGLTYNQIKDTLSCSKGTICFHLCPGQKEKTNKRTIRLRSKLHPYARKIQNFFIQRNRSIKKPTSLTVKKLFQLKLETFFKDRKNDNMYQKPTFTVEDVINKIGENPKCYLTGDDIDISKPKTYQFDHIIPVTKGGQNTLDNLGICTKDVNQAKFNLLPEDFILLCKKVIEHNGYKVTKSS